MQEINLEQFMQLPEVALVAIGHDLNHKAYVHVRMPSAADLRVYSRWAQGADFVLCPYGAFSVSVVERWPQAKVLHFGCTCCCSSDLVDENSCAYCGVLFEEHKSGCPSCFADNIGEWSAAYKLFQEGKEQGLIGHRCTQKSASGRLGYQSGREVWKHRFDRQLTIAR